MTYIISGIHELLNKLSIELINIGFMEVNEPSNKTIYLSISREMEYICYHDDESPTNALHLTPSNYPEILKKVLEG